MTYDTYIDNAFIVGFGNDDGYLADKDNNMLTMFYIYAHVFFNKEDAEKYCSDFPDFGFRVIPATVEVRKIGDSIDSVQVVEVN